jgi:hypothetical protein
MGKSLIPMFFIFYSFLLKEKYISINPIINHQYKNRSIQNDSNNPAISQLILPIFDDKKYIDKNNNFSYLSKNYCIQDLNQALNFIKIYKNKDRYIPIRKEVERLLHWCTLIAKISLKDLTPIDGIVA